MEKLHHQNNPITFNCLFNPVVFRCTSSDYPFGIAKPFLMNTKVAINNVQSRDAGNTGNKTENDEKQNRQHWEQDTE
jgi:hypothetical protein